MVRVVFVHPDLGIGGAERLVVDAAVALQRRGHTVTMYTAHHDPLHCFPETRDGTLRVCCVGDWLPRSLCGYLMALCAYVRMVFLALYIRYFLKLDYEVAFVDQISACVPFLSGYKSSKVLFYCHYPDKLLTQRNSVAKKVYRFIIDWVEEVTTKCADCIVVNSEFTAGVFKTTFQSIEDRPIVLYPSLDFSKFDDCSDIPLTQLGLNQDYEVLFLSLNRFERKKNLSLALHAFKHLQKLIQENNQAEASKKILSKMHLVIAGGYDVRNIENIQHYNELIKLCHVLKLDDSVTFMKSPNEQCKVNLLRRCSCLLYTPDCEHFGIVPLEAMYCGSPVVAVNSGGPKETIVHKKTGFLCPQTPQHFAEALHNFVLDKHCKTVMGQAGKQRVEERFSFDKFSQNLDSIINGLTVKKLK